MPRKFDFVSPGVVLNEIDESIIEAPLEDDGLLVIGQSPSGPSLKPVRVKNLQNGTSVIVKVNDRGPFKDNRIIDLSYAAAKGIGMLDDGTAFVELTNITRQQAARSMYYENKSSIAKEKITAITQLSNDNIYLQIGAFKTKSNARKLKNRVEEKDIDNVYIKKARTKIGTLYRVRIGPIGDIERYDEIIKLLISLSLDITLVTN